LPLSPIAAPLLADFADVFAESLPPSLPPSRDIDHRIDLLPDSAPVFSRPYRIAEVDKKELETQLEDLLDKGFIRRSRSPFASPVLFVPKKDGKLRLCVDYRRLNQITVRDRYPLPLIDDLFNRLRNAKYFSSCDAVSGYYQVRIHPPDIPKTAFTTPFGSFEFLVLPFGLCGAPSTFMRLMDSIFPASFRKFLVWYLDDLLIFSETEEQHLEHLRLVFEKLREHRIYLKPSKCSFFLQELPFLGHVISAEGVSTDPSKIESISSWPTPKTLKDLRGFMGLAGYYHKFVKDFARLSAPLVALTKKDADFEWTEAQQQAFDAIKSSLSSPQILLIPDPNQPFTLETDASDLATGAVLSQKDSKGTLRPVAFLSKKLNRHELNYAVHEKETLAVIHAIEKMRHFLIGTHTEVITDHQSIRYLLSQASLSRRQARWLAKIQDLDLTIHYRPGPENVVADSLSRIPSSSLNVVSSISLGSDLLDQIRDGYSADHKLFPIVTALRDASAPDPSVASVLHRYKLSDGILFKLDSKPRICVPRVPLTIQKILEETHDTKTAGHLGFEKTYAAVSESFYWPKMDKSVRSFVRSCTSCQRNKPANSLSPGLAFPLDVPEKPWQEISLDFVGPFPETASKHNFILVIIDRLSKMVRLLPTTTKVSAKEVALMFLSRIFPLHGIPGKITSDRDPRFISNFWREFFKSLGSSLNLSTAYHPQTDGQTERVNRDLGVYLRHFVSRDHKNWDNLLPFAEFAFNNTKHSSTGLSPFQLCFTYSPAAPIDLLPRVPSASPAADQTLTEFSNMLRLARDSIHEAQTAQSAQNNKKHHSHTFAVGDLVTVDATDTDSPTTANSPSKKLRPKWLGPFEILKLKRVTAELKMPPGMKSHPVFHFSKLRPYNSNPVDEFPRRSLPPDPPILSDGHLEYEVDRILDKRRNRGRTEYLVQWKGYSDDEITWEPPSHLKNARIAIRDYERSLQRGGE